MLAPPKIKAAVPPGLVRWSGIFFGMMIVGGLVIVFFFNPKTHGFYPVCEFHRLTGLNCPGCGGTRSLYALLHGQFQTAFRDNALFLACLVFGTARAAWLGIRKWRGQPSAPWLSSWMLWTLLLATIAFGVIRNLPGFEWLAPL